MSAETDGATAILAPGARRAVVIAPPSTLFFMTDADDGALREHYHDLREIERRPEGIRYSATLSDGTPVVALAIAPGIADRMRHPERFITAMERSAAVHHEALPRPLAWGRVSDGRLHCAYARIDRIEIVPGALPPSDVAVIGVQLARALTAAHNAGLVHGAITTASIFQSRELGTQLNDFGLFAALNEGGLGVQGTALLLSDPAYVSPEAHMGKAPDERSDIFSLGASLFELLTGKPPYGGRTTSFVMAAVLSDQTGASPASNDAIAGPVIDALLRAIERAPDDRWPNAVAFASALSASATNAEMTAARPADKGRGCLPAAAGATVACGIAMALAGAFAR